MSWSQVDFLESNRLPCSSQGSLKGEIKPERSLAAQQSPRLILLRLVDQLEKRKLQRSSIMLKKKMQSLPPHLFHTCSFMHASRGTNLWQYQMHTRNIFHFDSSSRQARDKDWLCVTSPTHPGLWLCYCSIANKRRSLNAWVTNCASSGHQLFRFYNKDRDRSESLSPTLTPFERPPLPLPCCQQ